jgi:hypothetical protein
MGFAAQPIQYNPEIASLPPARRYIETFKEARMTKVLVWLVTTSIGLAPAIAQARSGGTSGARNISTQSGAATLKKLPGKTKPATLTLKRGATKY